MKIFALVLVALTLAFSNCEPVEYADNQKPRNRQSQTPNKEGLKARVVGISDGDSIVVLVNGNERERVRLATIDAPENGQAHGKPSKQKLSDLIYKKDVRIVEQNRDQYGRIVGEVFLGDLNINLEQLKSGMAWHYKAHAKEQTRASAREYAQAESDAKFEGIGLWREKNPTPPWIYRQKNPRN